MCLRLNVKVLPIDESYKEKALKTHKTLKPQKQLCEKCIFQAIMDRNLCLQNLYFSLTWTPRWNLTPKTTRCKRFWVKGMPDMPILVHNQTTCQF